MPLSLQNLDCSHSVSCFCPLLALQLQQHRTIFSLLMTDTSLMMCSQLAAVFIETFAGVKSTSQYTQVLSLSRTSFSSHAGIFQLFAISFYVLLRITPKSAARFFASAGVFGYVLFFGFSLVPFNLLYGALIGAILDFNSYFVNLFNHLRFVL